MVEAGRGYEKLGMLVTKHANIAGATITSYSDLKVTSAGGAIAPLAPLFPSFLHEKELYHTCLTKVWFLENETNFQRLIYLHNNSIY